MNQKVNTIAIVSILGSVVIILSCFAGLTGSFLGSKLFSSQTTNGETVSTENVSIVNEESAIIDVAATASPSVVSVIISKDLPVYQNYFYNGFGFPSRQQVGTEEQQIGSGSGFVISADGLILTNKHVVSDTEANYTVVFNDGTTADAQVLARDQILDIAVIKIDTEQQLVPLEFGDSDKLQIGQTAIAIGNSLGEFSNTVSSGIISGLSRSIIAGGGGESEQLEDVIQTDASINPGNSGGPLLDVSGNVIGVNVAVAQNAENIGFAIPINSVKTVVDSVRQYGEIVRPYLGVRYLTITEDVLAQYTDLSVDHGALLVEGSNGEAAVLADSPADDAGLQTEDIITAINGNDLTTANTLQDEIQKYQVGESVSIEYVRGGNTYTTQATLAKLDSE